MNAHSTITSLIKKYKRDRLLETTLLAFSIALLAVIGAEISTSLESKFTFILGCVICVGIFVLQYYRLQLHKLYPIRIVQYLNVHYPELKFSADLLLRDIQTLSGIEKIQQQQTALTLDQLKNKITFPHRITMAIILFISSILISLIIYKVNIDKENNTAFQEATRNAETVLSSPLPPTIEKINITIKPPVYTQLPNVQSQNPNLRVIEGSTVTWIITMTQPANRVYLIFASGDTLQAKGISNTYTLSTTLTTTGFYQIGWRDEISDYYKLDVVYDLEPKITPLHQHQFIEFEFNSKKNFTVATNIEDDFGIRETYIIATVSKGSGESVKFREEKLLFTTPHVVTGKEVNVSRNINLDKLGMEPGDELYYYIVAVDNKQPIPNKNRTETFFVSLKDTATVDLSFDGGFGVDLMPEYFRSQRQIIIDTEKLIREKKTITKQEFNTRSNELGYDQKVLRLRYGQFMGEEFESGMTQESITQEDHDHDHEEEDVVKKFGHAHDTENEHNHVEHKKEELHNHQHESKKPDEPQNMLDEFVHMHDDAEVATFFIQSLKAKLKAALTVMWDAELYLRLYEPEKSLPYQYTALRLLKEISNDSRIYVHRTGFDPPPIKEDRRLSADLSEIHSEIQRWVSEETVANPAIRQALPIIEIISRTNSITVDQRAILQKAGNELAQLAIANPGEYLASLSALRNVLDDKLSRTEFEKQIRIIQQACWLAIPQETARTGSSMHGTPLNEQLLQELQSISN